MYARLSLCDLFFIVELLNSNNKNMQVIQWIKSNGVAWYNIVVFVDVDWSAHNPSPKFDHIEKSTCVYYERKSTAHSASSVDGWAKLTPMRIISEPAILELFIW